MTSPRPGEIRVASHPDVGVRFLLITHVDDESPFALGVLLSEEIENRTDVDLMLPSHLTGLEFDLLAQADLEGPVWFEQLGEAAGSPVQDVFVEALAAVRDEDDRLDYVLKEVERASAGTLRAGVGTPVTGPSDPRWEWKEAELDVLQALTGDCMAALEERRAWTCDEVIDLVTGETVPADAADRPSIWLRVPMEDGVRLDANILDAWLRVRWDPDLEGAAALAASIGEKVRPPAGVPSEGSLRALFIRTPLGLAVVRLAVAEGRVATHPSGPWAIDSALALVDVLQMLDHDDPGGFLNLRAVLRERAAQAMDVLETVPGSVLAPGDRGNLSSSLEPLRAELVGSVEIARLDAWARIHGEVDGGWDGQLLSMPAPAGADMGGEAPRYTTSVPLPLAMHLSWLVERGTRVSLKIGEPSGGVTASLLVAREVSEAFIAWRRAVTDDAGAVDADGDRRHDLRWRLVTRALLRLAERLPLGESDASGATTVLPDVWAQAYDVDTGKIQDAFRLEPIVRSEGVVELSGAIPGWEPGWGIDVTTSPGTFVDAVDFRSFIVTFIHDAGLAAEVAADTSRSVSDAERAVLLRLAAVAQRVSPGGTSEARSRTGAAEESAWPGQFPGHVSALADDATVASRLFHRLKDARERAAADVLYQLRDLGDFDNLDGGSQEARLSRAQDLIGEIQKLDELLL
jgi:hypothetical protein